MNICSEDLLSPAIFGLKWHEKLKYLFSSDSRDMGKVIPVIFGEIKMSASIFGKATAAQNFR